MDLPVEIWMLVFEHLDHQPHKARLSVLDAFSSAMQNDMARENLAVKSLPNFEKQIWKAARSYYKINQASRAAADAIMLSKTLLYGCEPIENMTSLGLALATFQDSVNTSRLNNTPPPTILSIDVTHASTFFFMATNMPIYSNGKWFTRIAQAGEVALGILRPYLIHSFANFRSPFHHVRHIQLLARRQPANGHGFEKQAMAWFAAEVEHLISEHILDSRREALLNGRVLRCTVELVWD